MKPEQAENLLPIPARRESAEALDFRTIHPRLFFGTASDRYAGWIGQIYGDHWHAEVQTRSKKLDKETFQERQLPIESVGEYFEHFNVLELDFTFYRPLLEPTGKPSGNLFVLEKYAEAAPPNARFLIKAPQIFFARLLRRSARGQVRYEPNQDFLNAEAYVKLFHEPARNVLGDRLVGILFEQEYQRVRESPSPEQNIVELDGFFRDIPGDVQAHIELRSQHLLVPPYFEWLGHRGIGFVISHWTWLPSVKTQWQLCGGRFTAGNREAVVRLLTPLNMPYAAAYSKAYPFDRPVPELAETPQARQMIDETTALAYHALEQGVTLSVIANNRAYGNAPALAQAIAHRFLDFADQKNA